jgi:chromosome segregation ATPase
MFRAEVDRLHRQIQGLERERDEKTAEIRTLEGQKRVLEETNQELRARLNGVGKQHERVRLCLV